MFYLVSTPVESSGSEPDAFPFPSSIRTQSPPYNKNLLLK